MFLRHILPGLFGTTHAAVSFHGRLRAETHTQSGSQTNVHTSIDTTCTILLPVTVRGCHFLPFLFDTFKQCSLLRHQLEYQS
ncbi:hypothetical protein B0J12DRAFT_427116 [Macrophomina phaseolina]|uniref:Secreted protein n=1 Tax=Macrophomina phaseolina TaxID=35725 RepID=A0ABQ8GGT6_9PEZI|nr:hypothetical protein B0J12DRAFT_427116 [Macrophomina phaseolina]